ncbi:MAG: S9 family peptidase [Anaerolineae bacterium]
MQKSNVVSYGSWPSPISSNLIVSATVRLGTPVLDGEDIYWLEGRPSEGGRHVIVRRTPEGDLSDVLPAPYNARTRVHEYGGGSFVVHEGMIIFSNFADQRLYRMDAEPALPGSRRSFGRPRPITPETALRYADGVFDTVRDRLICVREDHRISMREATNTIVEVNPSGDVDGGQVLVSGNDFYATPRLNPAGDRLIWLTWNHPNMPWDGTELWMAEVHEDGSLGEPRKVAGGATESIFQPTWSPDGTLYFVSDRTGWWNLYRLRDGEIEPLVDLEAEFGLPQWVFDMSTYDFAAADRIVCCYSQSGVWHLAELDTNSGKLNPFDLPYTEITSPKYSPQGLVFRGGSPTAATALVLFELDTGATEVLRSSSRTDLSPSYFSVPEVIDYETEGGKVAHAFFYPPTHPDHEAPDGELPPLLVFVHGGPTGSASTTLDLSRQYWTSRGFALLDVNYRGSTGYGRAYRQDLEGVWGIADVLDCVHGARHLVMAGRVDGKRLAIRGGSAGGYTTLSALTFYDTFDAGASYYGVADLEALAKETHKFESRYLDKLVGPYPEEKDLYEERSPIHHTDQLSCPVIFLQGLEDEVVPPNQAEMMVKALREKGVPVAYLTFEGEQHGFRRAENMKRALDAELYFYARIFGFKLADPVPPVEIENL